MQIGYARMSTPEQSLALQLDGLQQAGCRKVYEEVISVARIERPVLQVMPPHLRAGDVLLIWKLERLRAVAPASHRGRHRSGVARVWLQASPGKP